MGLFALHIFQEVAVLVVVLVAVLVVVLVCLCPELS